MMSGNGSYKPKNSGDGMLVAKEVKMEVPFFLVMGIPGPERHLSGNRDLTRGGEESELC